MKDQPTALLFDIVHGSFVDGPGIRTTIFLKGCPLRCVWCCNPEGQSPEPELIVRSSKCTGCGNCVDRCPKGALTVVQGVVSVDRERCDACGECFEHCYPGALDRFGTWLTVDEVFDIVTKEEAFYAASGGGLTIGGGEPTRWPDFVLALLRKCRAHGIHTAIDTCGFVTTDKGRRCLEESDLVLFDLKGFEPAAHKVNTGRSNEVIINNLYSLSKLDKPRIIVRIPLIPGYNDDEDMLREEAATLSKLGKIDRVDIIPFHEYGKTKYDCLSKEYGCISSGLSEEDQQHYLQLFASYGLETHIGG